MRHLIIHAACVALAMTFASIAVSAQEGAAEAVVVTGARLSEYDSHVIPHIVLVRRATQVISTLTVACDTRDKAQRLTELKDTLSALVRSAGGKNIAFGVTKNDVVRDLDERMFDDLIGTGSRPDTSQLFLTIRTNVVDSDTLEDAIERIRTFVDKATRIGRSEITLSGGWDLILLSPERNRDELMKRIVDDAKRTADLLGPTTGITIEGLQKPIEWYRSGPLELSLYIPHSLVVAPK